MKLLFALDERPAWADELIRRAGSADLPPNQRVWSAGHLAEFGDGEARRHGLDLLATLADDSRLDPDARKDSWRYLEKATSESDGPWQ